LRVPKAFSSDRGVGTTRFDTRRADWERFSESLVDLSRSKLEVLNLNSANEVEEMAEALQDAITASCELSMPRKKMAKKSNPWWNQELTDRKKSVNRLRRDFQEKQ
jgi:hypothetical protein